MSVTWPCRCAVAVPHPNLPDGFCACGGWNVTLGLIAAGKPFKPVPDKPVTTIRPPTETEE